MGILIYIVCYNRIRYKEQPTDRYRMRSGSSTVSLIKQIELVYHLGREQ